MFAVDLRAFFDDVDKRHPMAAPKFVIVLKSFEDDRGLDIGRVESFGLRNVEELPRGEARLVFNGVEICLKRHLAALSSIAVTPRFERWSEAMCNKNTHVARRKEREISGSHSFACDPVGQRAASRRPGLKGVLKLADDVRFNCRAILKRSGKTHFNDVTATVCCSRAQFLQGGDVAGRVVAHARCSCEITKPKAFFVERDVVH